MRILIVSGKEYTLSNRGIDVITTFLSKQYTVDHLFFYIRDFKEDKIISNNLTQKYYVDYSKLYRDKFKYFLPGFLLEIIFDKMMKANKFDFSKYDYIILESGYPILFARFVNNKKLIYRQSDPVEIAFNTKRRYFRKKEKYILQKSISVSSALNPIFYPKEFEKKFMFWKSGFLFPEVSFLPKKNLIVYMGGVPIDYVLLKQVAQKFSNYEFVIIGNHKNKCNKNNVHFMGYLNFENYKNYIIQSKVFFMPIANSYLKHLKTAFDLTSKFYLPLALGIPFVTHVHGYITRTDIDKKIFLYKNRKEALKIFSDILENNMYQDFQVSPSTKDFLLKQTIEYKEEELNEYFKKINCYN